LGFSCEKYEDIYLNLSNFVIKVSSFLLYFSTELSSVRWKNVSCSFSAALRLYAHFSSEISYNHQKCRHQLTKFRETLLKGQITGELNIL